MEKVEIIYPAFQDVTASALLLQMLAVFTGMDYSTLLLSTMDLCGLKHAFLTIQLAICVVVGLGKVTSDMPIEDISSR
jgi:hypothetical protein